MSDSAAVYKLSPAVRDLATLGVGQAKKVFDSSTGTAHKALGYAEENISAYFAYTQKILNAQDMQEVLQLQADYIKTQMSALQRQMQDLGSSIQTSVQKAQEDSQALAQRAASDTREFVAETQASLSKAASAAQDVVAAAVKRKA